MDMQLRQAEFKDLEAILDIINHAIIHTTAVYDYQPRTLDMQRRWLEKKQADNMPVVVTQVEGDVVGFGSYAIFRPWDGFQFSVEHSIYVAEKARGKGVGGKLLSKLVKLARVQGFHTMIAGIDAENKISYAFHKKFGFTEVGRLKEVGFKFDKWLDLVFMQLLLRKDEMNDQSK